MFDAGRPADIRLFLLVSFLVCILEAFLLFAIWSARASPVISIAFYPMPIIHLLPWFASLRTLRKLDHEVSGQLITVATANTCYRRIIGLLATTYVVLGVFEIAFGLAWRHGSKL